MKRHVPPRMLLAIKVTYGLTWLAVFGASAMFFAKCIEFLRYGLSDEYFLYTAVIGIGAIVETETIIMLRNYLRNAR